MCLGQPRLRDFAGIPPRLRFVKKLVLPGCHLHFLRRKAEANFSIQQVFGPSISRTGEVSLSKIYKSLRHAGEWPAMDSFLDDTG